MKILCICLIAMNLLAFSLMGADKSRARRGDWRIPEKTLFLSALLGGSLGANLGMQIFRHKTKKRAFVLGFPGILLLHLLIAALWLLRTT